MPNSVRTRRTMSQNNYIAIRCDSSRVCLHVNYKAHVACNLSFVVKNERVLKVTGSHVHFKVVVSEIGAR